ncbi:hypothetical protein [Actinoplanes couchii]|nr:hypothetical protein [Actinoplanes couchii]MDR6319051.1 hypothetical protein [Actinoplanes couchii]
MLTPYGGDQLERSSLSLSVDERRRVIVRVDGVDVSRADGNDGPDPWHVLVPVNRFAAQSVVIAACRGCGPDCFAVEATIRRDGDVVRWEWDGRTVVFDAGAYDAEVARFGVDHGWETPLRRAGRLILTDLPLPPGVVGVRVSERDTGELEVWLEEPDHYQIFVRTPWNSTCPHESAATARTVLTGPPSGWPAQWHGVPWERRETPPGYAGPSWRRVDWD